MGSLEFDQGLDVLVIMRHLHVFVARFSYNLNQQNFVERRPDRGSKNLNTISSKSIAASLRQHGLGILSTTVNFTYQFLAQKFKVFSHFLLDEYIRGHLSKERRWFRKHKAESGNLYPHGRALGFAMDIGKLGVLESGRTFLDQFRILITEIGNALGYVRMVRSAGMHHCAEAAQFLPTSTSRHADHKTKAEEEMEPFKFYQHLAQPGGSGGAGGTGGDGVSGGGLGQSFWSEGTLAASRTLDTVAQTLGANAGGKDGATDYFKALVQVFQQVLFDDSADGNPTSEEGTSRPIHLDNFYMIIPSLCLSWIDASCQAKNFMYKSNRAREAYYTDDGFAVGLAFILAITRQQDEFDALHWFQAVRSELDREAEQLGKKRKDQLREREAGDANRWAEKSKAGGLGALFGAGRAAFSKQRRQGGEEHAAAASGAGSGTAAGSGGGSQVALSPEEEEEAIQTLQQSEKRLEAMRRENDLLFFSLSGARIFFKR
mmetsp:Transcript_16268/g.37737  ORF Transcript_16268/g.37737 Transcript_16268/m.37737 type:complete len:488 (+) Transcript_16268:293-1756(+)